MFGLESLYTTVSVLDQNEYHSDRVRAHKRVNESGQGRAGTDKAATTWALLLSRVKVPEFYQHPHSAFADMSRVQRRREHSGAKPTAQWKNPKLVIRVFNREIRILIVKAGDVYARCCGDCRCPFELSDSC